MCLAQQVPRWCCLGLGDLCDTLGGGRSWHLPTQLCRVQWGAGSYPSTLWLLGNPGSQELACTPLPPVCWEQAGQCQAKQRGCNGARPQSAFLCNCTSKAGAPEKRCWALGFSHGVNSHSNRSLAVPGDLTVC